MATHTCTVCKVTGQWSPDWAWWGSIREFEAGLPIIKTCSETCRERVNTEGGPEKWAAELRGDHPLDRLKEKRKRKTKAVDETIEGIAERTGVSKDDVRKVLAEIQS